ncbi:hypothetical protein P9A16_30455 [Shinella sp. 838]|uniref:hypothetical protein n=2 Tax=Shinella TaxID=323620 RepID=UPI001FDA0C2C|nr:MULTISPECIES: hypothetical protein [unclassified Shinella]MCA0338114.1 hypothetical protein [Pseudomonadota bacterium]MDG4675444.1 hypothetical protein [Shinella sp. 838]
MEAKAANAVIEELERQAADAPQRLRVQRQGDRVDVRGEIDVDALVMVVVGSMAGGP